MDAILAILGAGEFSPGLDALAGTVRYRHIEDGRWNDLNKLYCLLVDLRQVALGLAASPPEAEDNKPLPRWWGDCARCHRPYSDPGFPDLIVSDEAWRQISPTGGDGGLLCPSCIIGVLTELGIETEATFRSGPLAGQMVRFGGAPPEAEKPEPNVVDAAFAAQRAGYERLCLICLAGFDEHDCPRCHGAPPEASEEPEPRFVEFGTGHIHIVPAQEPGDGAAVMILRRVPEQHAIGETSDDYTPGDKVEYKPGDVVLRFTRFSSIRVLAEDLFGLIGKCGGDPRPVPPVEPTDETFDETLRRIRKEYEALPDAEWFRRVYGGKSLGEVILVEPEGDERP